MALMYVSHLLKRIAICFAVASCGVIWGGSASAADQPSALIVDAGNLQLRNNGRSNFGGLLGYDVTVGAADAQVTHLGVYDAPGNEADASQGQVGDGLEQSAVVGIYQVSDRQLIAQATVPAGDAGELIDGFRYVKLDEPVTLKANQTYRVVMGVAAGGNGFRNYGGGASAPVVSRDFKVGSKSYHHVQRDSAALAYPVDVRKGSPYVGPNFRYTGGAPAPLPPKPVATEEPGDRLRDIDSLPGKAVLAEDFEKVEGTLPEGWSVVPQVEGKSDYGMAIDSPGAGNAGSAMKLTRRPDTRWLGKFGGLNYTLSEPADRIALEFDLKTTAPQNFYPAIEAFTFGPGSGEEPTQLRMRIHPHRMHQYSIATGWAVLHTGAELGVGDAAPWRRIRLVIDRDAPGIAVYISEPDKAQLPDKPFATIPAYARGQAIAAVRFSVRSSKGRHETWIDNVSIRTGQDIPAPGKIEQRYEKKPDEGYPLWTGGQFPDSFDQIDYPQGIEHHIVASRGQKWRWFHGAAIEFHKGKFYTSWGANAKGENVAGEITVYSESSDGGKTWTETRTLAPGDGKGGVEFSNSHGTLLSHDGKLWSFNQHWAGGWDNPLSTEAFILNEEKDEWESQGIVATQGWPLDRPKKLPDGNWIMGVSGFKMLKPAVMISHGDDLTKWDTIAIPTEEWERFPETSVIVDGKDLLSIIRWRGGRAMTSTSTDGGRTWATSQRSNLPMDTSKPDSGLLSTGQRYAVINIGDRDALMLVVGKPGEKGFSQAYKVRYGTPLTGEYAYQGSILPYRYAYPYAREHAGKLYIVYSVGLADIELAIIPIASLKAQ